VPGASSTTPRNFNPRLLGTDASPQRTGVPTPPPMPSGITPQQWAEEQKTRTAKMNDAIDKATPELRKSIELINLARTHPGLDWGTGATGEFMRERAGTSAYAFGSLMKQITGKNFMAGYQDLRGAGNIGEKEGAKAEQAQASIDPNQSKEDLKASLQRLEDTLRNNVEVAQRATNRPVTAWQTSPNDPYAPDIGQIGKDAKTGKLQQYIGGNPKLDSSYRDVR
jgi:hypothetical protein